MKARARPPVLQSQTYMTETGHGTLHLIVCRDEDGALFEVFGHIGKAGSCQRAEMEEISRLVSLALRCGVDVEEIVGQLQGIKCGEPVWYEGEQVTSIGDALARLLSQANEEKAR